MVFSVHGVDPYPYNDYEQVQMLTKLGINAIKSDPVLHALLDEYLFLLKHTFHRPYQLRFVKCDD